MSMACTSGSGETVAAREASRFSFVSGHTEAKALYEYRFDSCLPDSTPQRVN